MSRSIACVLCLTMFAVALRLHFSGPSQQARAWEQATPKAATETPAPRPSSIPADLSVQWISRIPRYPRYCVEYERVEYGGAPVPRLCAETEAGQHFPEPGEPITLTARVANQGDALSALAPYTWYLDGEPVAEGDCPTLAPGQWISLTLPWSWATSPHTITLALDSGDLTEANNRLAHRTNAHSLEVWAHPAYLEAFAQHQNLLGSYSFHDWLQGQIAAMNQRLAKAVYPNTPDGVPDRIRVDTVRVTNAVMRRNLPEDLTYDGRWVFRPKSDDHHTSEDETWVSAQRHAAAFAHAIEWSLIHELTHQLGVIDLYWLNVSPSRANPLLDRQGLPLLLGFSFASPGLMSGDTTGPYDQTHYSEHTAMALSSNHGHRRGYFGEYLYNLPETVYLRVVDRFGVGLPCAQIRAYQTDHTVLQPEPVWQGITDEDGWFPLPARPVSPTITATGHVIHPNPYGQIDVVGRNGQLLLQITKGEQEAWRWLPITELNKAFWRGQDPYRMTLQTHLVGREAAQGRPQLTAETWADQARLQWDPVDEVVSYDLYRGVWPDYALTRFASGLSVLSQTVNITGPTRFAVAAVWTDGGESPLSPLVRTEPLQKPYALLWQDQAASAPEGRLLVVDSHRGALLAARRSSQDSGPGIAWVGRIGSEHLNLVDAHGAAVGPNGLLGTVTRDGGRAWILDQDAKLITWFGEIPDYAKPLPRPVDLLLAGDPFTTALSCSDLADKYTRLSLPLDGTADSLAGLEPLRGQGLTYVPGRFGQGLYFRSGGQLRYPIRKRFEPKQGSVAFWVQPYWFQDPLGEHVLLEIASQNVPGYKMRVAHEGDWLYAQITDNDQHELVLWGEAWDWQPGRWHHVALTWSDHRASLYLDGHLESDAFSHHAITGTVDTLSVGATITGGLSAEAVIDEVQLDAIPRLGNSRDVRVIVAQETPGQLGLFDLLGNPISTYVGHPDPDRFQPAALAWAANGTGLWVTDREARRLDKVRFDTEGLTWERRLGVTWEAGPTALAQSSELLAVADGALIRLIDPQRPDKIETLHHDAQGRPFVEPRAVAFDNHGGLFVADAGSRRVSYLPDAIYSQRGFLPSIRR